MKQKTPEKKQEQELVGVIAAAGKGTRAYPRTDVIPKPLFQFEGISLLERNIRLLVEQFKVKKIYIIVGHLKEHVIAEVHRIQSSIKAQLITSPWTEKGLAADVASLEQKITGPFVLLLGDEFYIATDHSKMLTLWWRRKTGAVIGALKTPLTYDIRKNYSVELKGTEVFRLVEKPENPPNDLLGLGSYIFDQSYFEYYRRTVPSERSGVIELTDVIHEMSENKLVHAAILSGYYYNINSMADYHAARYLLSTMNFNQYKISLLLSASPSAEDAGADFKPYVHEIRVAIAGRPLLDTLTELNGNIIIYADSSGIIRSHDVMRMLECLKESDMVYGSTMYPDMVEKGLEDLAVNYRSDRILMRILAFRYPGNVWKSPGQPFFAIRKEALEQLTDIADPDRPVEIAAELLKRHYRVMEVPVSLRMPFSGIVKQRKKTGLLKSIARIW